MTPKNSAKNRIFTILKGPLFGEGYLENEFGKTSFKHC